MLGAGLSSAGGGLGAGVDTVELCTVDAGGWALGTFVCALSTLVFDALPLAFASTARPACACAVAPAIRSDCLRVAIFAAIDVGWLVSFGGKAATLAELAF